MAALSTIALLAVSAAKSGLNYMEQRSAAKAAEQQGNEQASLFRTNAQLADNQATDALERGNQQAGRVQGETRLLGGAQRAAFAAQGIDVSTGSAADVTGNDRRLGELDALTIKNNAKREAFGFQTQARAYRSQADYTQAAGRNQAKGIRRQAFGTLLGGAAELVDIYSSAPHSVGRGSSLGAGVGGTDYTRGATGATNTRVF